MHYDLGFMIQCLMHCVDCLGSGMRVKSSNSVFRVEGSGFEFGFRVEGLGFRVWV